MYAITQRLILGFLYTTAIVQSCTWSTVQRIPWDPTSTSIIIRTDSVAGDGDKASVWFYDGGNAGAFDIVFDSEIYISLLWCGYRAPFPDTLPTETDKTWMVTYDTGNHEMTIYCNHVKVAAIVLADVCSGGWETTWGRLSSHSEADFSPFAKATDSYCISDIVECTGLDPALHNLKTETTFPVMQGVLMEITCISGHLLQDHEGLALNSGRLGNLSKWANRHNLNYQVEMKRSLKQEVQ